MKFPIGGIKVKKLILILLVIGPYFCNASTVKMAGGISGGAISKQFSSANLENKPGIIFVKDAETLMQTGKDLENQGQQNDEFSNKHYAVLVAPGKYVMTDGGNPRAFNLGYNTQVLGVGKYMDDVSINPGVEAYNLGGNPNCFDDPTNEHCLTKGALVNFWRGIENFSIERPNDPRMGSLIFAVSQAAPIRSIHFISNALPDSNVLLCDWHAPGYACGYSSGGFMANSIVDGIIRPGSQRQWISRNSEYKSYDPQSYEGAIWNSVFLGTSVTNPASPPQPYIQPKDNEWPNFPITNIKQSNISKEKPYLTCTDSCFSSPVVWKVEVPQTRWNSEGVDDFKTLPPKELDVSSQFIVVSADSGKTDQAGVTTLDKDAIKKINESLKAGLNLIIAPGVYNLDGGVIKITNDNTVVLGLGVPSLVCTNAEGCIQVTAKAGVDLAGFILDAGYNSTPSLLQVGPVQTSSSSGDSSNPIFLHDIYFRIAETQLDTRLPSKERHTVAAAIINTSYVVGDNLWIWRADHDKASLYQKQDLGKVKWSQDTAQYGLIVYGDNVTINGLAVEHFQDYQTVWYGENGLVNFYQSEMPYDAPDLLHWVCTDPKTQYVWIRVGCASYVVDKDVKKHTANGLGIYTYFIVPKHPPKKFRPVMVLSAVIVPPSQNSVSLNHLVGVWLANDRSSGGYENLVTTTYGQDCWGFGVNELLGLSVLGEVSSTSAKLGCLIPNFW
ncbi:MAG: ricin-type beta-trefoil lectin domain protein [Burkholderiales bacterium]|nr:ricin-type beta-trefoil lectin domain protein [Burkholderiales bacterium]